MDAGLKRELEAKVYAGERLTREDGVALYESDDLAWLGRLAGMPKPSRLTSDRMRSGRLPEYSMAMLPPMLWPTRLTGPAGL